MLNVHVSRLLIPLRRKQQVFEIDGAEHDFCTALLASDSKDHGSDHLGCTTQACYGRGGKGNLDGLCLSQLKTAVLQMIQIGHLLGVTTLLAGHVVGRRQERVLSVDAFPCLGDNCFL